MDSDLVQQLLVAIEETVIFTVPPHYERWEDGFKSLDVVRKKLSKIKVRLEHESDSPSWLIADLASIHGKLNDFVKLRDDFYRNFPNGGESHSWAARESAERALADLQREVGNLKNNLRRQGTSNNDHAHKRQAAEKAAVFVFGTFFIVTLLVIAIQFPTPTRFQYEVFKVVLALAAAGFAAMIPGLLGVKVPGIKAGGAIAVFVLVMYKSPADFVVTPPQKPVRGSVILRDGFREYGASGFKFSSAAVVGWDSRIADILAARQEGSAKTGFFLPYDSAPYRHPNLDRNAAAGIQKISVASLDDAQECPTGGYAHHWFQPEATAIYCVRTRSGSTYALIQVDAIDDDRIVIDYLYQPSGSNKF